MRHAREEPVPVEALLAPDPELALVWAPLHETGEAMPCGACEDTCTCEPDFWRPTGECPEC